MKTVFRTGILLMIFLAAPFYLPGCGGGNGNENTTDPENGTPTEEGENEVVAGNITSAKFTINEIWLRDSDGVEQQLLPAPREIELVPTSGDTAKIHVELNIPTGKYDRARLVVESGVVTLSNDVFVENGNIFSTELGNLKLPSAMQNGIKVNMDPAIELEASDVQELIFNVDFTRSFVFNGPANHAPGVKEVLFAPVIQIIKNIISGHISLTVNRPAGIKCSNVPEPLAGATVTAVDANTTRIIEQNTVTTTNELGQAVLQLLPGMYDIIIEAEGYNPLTIPSVEVRIARTTNLGQVAMARPVDSTAFDQDVALLMAIMSTYVYDRSYLRNEENVHKTLSAARLNYRPYEPNPKPAGYTNIIQQYLKSDDTTGGCWKLYRYIEMKSGSISTQLFVAYNVRTADLVVSFEGTSGDSKLDAVLYDYTTDAQIARVPWKLRAIGETQWAYRNGTEIDNAVHNGIKNAYLLVADTLQQTLFSAINDPDIVTNRANSRIYFTGHSLGGALANLAALDFARYLQAHGYREENIIMYSFGAPRSITENIRQEYHSILPNAYAVTAKDDIVAHILGTDRGIGTDDYTHIKRLRVLSTNILNKEESTVVNSEGEVVGEGRYKSIGRSRVEISNGLRLKGCTIIGNTVPGSYGNLGHDQIQYIRRIEMIDSNAIPDIDINVYDPRPRLTIDDRLRLIWKGGVQGPCDYVALYRTDKGEVPVDADNIHGKLNGWQWVVNGGGYPAGISRYITNTNPNGPIDANRDFWVGYVDGFGRIIKTKKLKR